MRHVRWRNLLHLFWAKDRNITHGVNACQGLHSMLRFSTALLLKPTTVLCFTWLFVALERASCDQIGNTQHKMLLQCDPVIPETWPHFGLNMAVLGVNKSNQTKVQSVGTHSVPRCAPSANKAVEMWTVWAPGSRLLWRVGLTACCSTNAFLSSGF